jgi:hypothetical protein
MGLVSLFVVTMLLACDNKDAGLGANNTNMLFNKKIEYIGDASAVGSVLEALDISSLGNYDISLKTNAKPLALTVNFNEINISADELNDKMQMYSYVLLALIGNADEVHWSINTDNIKGSRITTIYEANKIYDDVKSCFNSAESFHSFLVAIGYYK